MDTPIEKVHDLLNRPHSSADFSPAARYAVQRLVDYAEQEHELREKAETMFCNEWRGRNAQLPTCASSYRLCSRR